VAPDLFANLPQIPPLPQTSQHSSSAPYLPAHLKCPRPCRPPSPRIPPSPRPGRSPYPRPHITCLQCTMTTDYIALLCFPAGRSSSFRPQSHTFFHSAKKKVKICRKRTKYFQPQKPRTFQFKPPKCTSLIYFHWAVLGGSHEGPPGRVPFMQDPQKPLVWGFLCRKEHLPWRMSEETKFPYMGYTRFICSCSNSW